MRLEHQRKSLEEIPTNVTIFGQSSGGASINRLLVCPPARGLFQRVIIESSAVWNSRDSKASLANMEQRGVRFAETNGVHTLKELRALTANRLLEGFAKIRFDPCIDGEVLPDLAVNIFSQGGQAPVPMLIGSTSDEGVFAPIRAGTFRADIQKRFGAAAGELLKFYPADSDAGAAQSKHDERRDESAAGERAEAAAQAALGQPVWLYYFDRQPPGRDREQYGAFRLRPEIEYVFNTQNATDRSQEETDRDLATRKLISYWVNFAAHGNPEIRTVPACRNGQGMIRERI